MIPLLHKLSAIVMIGMLAIGGAWSPPPAYALHAAAAPAAAAAAAAAPAAFAAPVVPNGITSPKDGAMLSGMVDIMGNATTPNFLKWQLDVLAGGAEDAASFLAHGETAGEFTSSIDTTAYPNGEYALRLRVIRADGNYDEYVTQFTIANAVAGAFPAAGPVGGERCSWVTEDIPECSCGGPGQEFIAISAGSSVVLSGFRGHKDVITAVVYSPDGRLIATSDGIDVRLRDTAGNSQLFVTADPKKEFCCPSFSPDSRWLAAGVSEKATELVSEQGQEVAKLWDTTTGSES